MRSRAFVVAGLVVLTITFAGGRSAPAVPAPAERTTVVVAGDEGPSAPKPVHQGAGAGRAV
ncbi:hypothetical protein GCM10009639_53070 [Kitasatospora putterlickiae]|uniref:Uncharacterized protein n=1 Tax=Kitasatospora putterlickiae TaxID=221725 RepID=A0ABN1YIE8_9ACTN